MHINDLSITQTKRFSELEVGTVFRYKPAAKGAEKIFRYEENSQKSIGSIWLKVSETQALELENNALSMVLVKNIFVESLGSELTLRQKQPRQNETMTLYNPYKKESISVDLEELAAKRNMKVSEDKTPPSNERYANTIQTKKATYKKILFLPMHYSAFP